MIKNRCSNPKNGKTMEQFFDEVNSVHEAGHAVTTVILGGTVEHVNLFEPLGDFGSSARCYMDTMESNVIVSLAGMGAEILFRDGQHVTWSWLVTSSGRGDWKAIQKVWMEDSGFDKKTRAAFIKACKAKALQLLTQNWSTVIKVSDALREKRFLSGDDVRDICGQSKAR